MRLQFRTGTICPSFLPLLISCKEPRASSSLICATATARSASEWDPRGTYPSRPFVRSEKCEFCASSVSFLGYIVSVDKMKMDQSKGSSVTSWPAPDSHKKWQRFLSFANFYCHFIRNYSCVTAPWYLPKSPASGPLQWTRIWRFTSTPILQMPDPEFSVCARSGCFRWRCGRCGVHPPQLFKMDHKFLCLVFPPPAICWKELPQQPGAVASADGIRGVAPHALTIKTWNTVWYPTILLITQYLKTPLCGFESANVWVSSAN